MKLLRDPIIDKSPAQKQIRIDKLAAELHGLGYSVVQTVWLREIMSKNARQGAKYEVIA